MQDTGMSPYNPPPKAQKNGGNGAKGGGGGAKGGKNGGKAGGKGGVKKNKGKGKGCARTTPDGKGVCYSFNSQGCNTPDCRFAHVCGVCFKAGVDMHSCSCN